jgi:uncharacterized protein (TIGR03437 family)
MRAAAFLVLIAGVSSAQVQNAADVGAGAFTTILAQGSLAAIDFSQLTSTPVTSATVSLLSVNSTTPVPAQVVSVESFEIRFVVPPTFPTGAAQLIYKPGNQATQWTGVTIVPTSFALFRSGPVGPLIAQNVNADGTAVSNGLATPAQPGQAVVIWGTGLGSGLGSTPQSAVQITLGGVTQTVLYAAAPPYEPSVTQINFRVAAGTPDGCYVPLTVSFGTQSVTSFLSKTSDGLPCHHPFQLSVAALQLLDSGSSIQTGELAVTTGIEAASSARASRQESAQFQSQYLNAAQIANYFIGVAGNPAQPCSMAQATGVSESILLGGGWLGSGAPSTMTLKNATSTLPLPWTSPVPTDSPLNDLPPAIVAAGPWTWIASADSGFPASSFNFVLPPPIQIAGGAPVTIDRSQNQTIAWSGTGYDSTATLQLSLTAQYPGSPVLGCSVPAQAGAVTLPSNLLAQFNGGFAGVLSAWVNETGSGIPYANLTANGSPLLMLVLWSSTDARPVDFQ